MFADISLIRSIIAAPSESPEVDASALVDVVQDADLGANETTFQAKKASGRTKKLFSKTAPEASPARRFVLFQSPVCQDSYFIFAQISLARSDDLAKQAEAVRFDFHCSQFLFSMLLIFKNSPM